MQKTDELFIDFKIKDTPTGWEITCHAVKEDISISMQIDSDEIVEWLLGKGEFMSEDKALLYFVLASDTQIKKEVIEFFKYKMS